MTTGTERPDTAPAPDRSTANRSESDQAAPDCPAPHRSTAVHPVRVYHEARFRGDVETAAAQTGPGFTFRSPFVRSDSPTGHLDGLEGLLGIVTSVDLISEFYAEDRATLVYDVHTASPVGIQHTAEHFRLHDGRITAIDLIFDATPWHALMAAAGPAATRRTTDPATATATA
ncbi:hypothetical protein [Kitasatospora sp. NPDC088134]|uniref:hypothetical protein n=1 Tax=Kitasatospora sp. NPDC088134 TaxID=3364071 RepID=UPI00380077D5